MPLINFTFLFFHEVVLKMIYAVFGVGGGVAFINYIMACGFFGCGSLYILL